MRDPARPAFWWASIGNRAKRPRIFSSNCMECPRSCWERRLLAGPGGRRPPPVDEGPLKTRSVHAWAAPTSRLEAGAPSAIELSTQILGSNTIEAYVGFAHVPARKPALPARSRSQGRPKSNRQDPAERFARHGARGAPSGGRMLSMPEIRDHLWSEPSPIPSGPRRHAGPKPAPPIPRPPAARRRIPTRRRVPSACSPRLQEHAGGVMQVIEGVP